MALPSWKAPAELALGKLGSVELREEDPAQPALPRPGEDRLGPLAVRAVEPSHDGRGWRITVQPMAPGTAVIPPLDLGDGRRTPELRLSIPRSVAYGTPWVGVGGGRQDLLPHLEFPWAWASLLALPLAVLAWFVVRAMGRRRPARRRRAALRQFTQHWPPAATDRAALDAAHTAGRNLLAAVYGDEALSWGPQAFQERRLEIWSQWIRSLDAARFALEDPPFPSAGDLLAALERQ